MKYNNRIHVTWTFPLKIEITFDRGNSPKTAAKLFQIYKKTIFLQYTNMYNNLEIIILEEVVLCANS